jgi:hypothetical protein
MLDWQAGDAEIRCAGQPRLHDMLSRGGSQMKLMGDEPLADAGESLRDDPSCESRDGSDLDRLNLTPRNCLGAISDMPDANEEPLDLIMEEETLFGGSDPWPVAVQKLKSEIGFEILDQSRYGRLRPSQQTGCAGDAPSRHNSRKSI